MYVAYLRSRLTVDLTANVAQKGLPSIHLSILPIDVHMELPLDEAI